MTDISISVKGEQFFRVLIALVLVGAFLILSDHEEGWSVLGAVIVILFTLIFLSAVTKVTKKGVWG
ncbi:MAG: hypothetical protein J7K59_04460 [Candidatus Korarchaeota archaeon]|nr:hypothetical protein [Candidatus Korarchaeota archaeon]